MRKTISIIFLFQLLFACKGPEKTAMKSNEAITEVVLSEADEVKLMTFFMEASKAKMLGNLKEASEFYSRCIEIQPNHAASLFELANIYHYTGAKGIAIGYLEKAYSISPKNKWYGEKLAEYYIEQRDFKNAEITMKQLLSNDKENIEYMFELANIYIYMQELKKALSVYDQMEKLFGVNEDLNLRKKRIYQNQKNYAKAIEEVQKLVDAFPKEVRYYSMLAELHQAKGDPQKAMEIYEEIQKIEPNNPFVQLSLAEYYQKAGENQKAEGILLKAFSNQDLDVDTKVQILFNYFKQIDRDSSKLNEALDLAEITTTMHPESGKAHAMYGDFLYRANRLEEAEKSYQNALQQDKSNFLIWNQLMFVYADTEQYEKMREQSSQAIDLFPLQPSFFFFNGLAQMQLKNTKEAIKILEEGKDLVVGNNLLLAQFYANLGDAYFANNQAKEAFSRYEECLKIEPQNYVVLNNYAYYLSVQGENLDRAEEMSKKTIEQFPNSATYLDTYAWILYKQRKYQEAEKYMKAAIENGGVESAVILEHYGDILYQLGRKSEALDFWKQAEQKGSGSEFLKEKINKGVLIE